MEPSTNYIAFDRELDVLNPDTWEPDMEDVYRALPKINRFNGQTSEPYSVARHCLNCLHAAEQLYGQADHEFLLAVLLHDASEAYIGDIVRPIKQRFNGGLKVLEDTILKTIYKSVNVNPWFVYSETVKHIDTSMALTEINMLTSMKASSLMEGVQYYPDNYCEPTVTWQDDEHEFRVAVKSLAVRLDDKRYEKR